MSKKVNKQGYRIHLIVLNILEMYPDKYSKMYYDLIISTNVMIEGKYFNHSPTHLPVLKKFKF